MKVVVASLAKKIVQLIHNNSKALRDVSKIEGVTRILTRWIQFLPISERVAESPPLVAFLLENPG